MVVQKKQILFVPADETGNRIQLHNDSIAAQTLNDVGLSKFHRTMLNFVFHKLCCFII